MAENLTVYVNGRAVTLPAGSKAAGIAVMLAPGADVPDFGFRSAAGTPLRYGYLF